MSTEGNLTPNQLYIQGALENDVTITEPTPNLSTDQYTIPSSNDAIDVPRSAFVPCDNLLHEICLVDMLQICFDLDIHYRDVCNMLEAIYFLVITVGLCVIHDMKLLA